MIVPSAPRASRSACAGARDVSHAEGVAARARPVDALGDEGGFAPRPSEQRGSAAPARRGNRTRGLQACGRDRRFALDIAATELFHDNVYDLAGEGKQYPATDFAALPRGFLRSLPDRLHRGRHGRGRLGGWKAFTQRLGGRIQIVGDDVFVTNSERLARGIDLGVANSILVR